MAIKFNWDKIKSLHEDLARNGWRDEDNLLFITVSNNGTPRKTIIKFKEFLQFFWKLTDSNVLTFVIQGQDGKILYRHKTIIGQEEIPNDGNLGLILKWPSMSKEERETYLRILISQINSYDD